MSNYPNFSKQGYQIIRELGHNRVGGRVTYLATDTITQLPVVIKQFQFAQSGASWTEYDAVKSEMQVLRSLKSPNIPRYLNSFETPTGFCLVQEYKDAPSLAESRQFTPQEIKEIALAILQVLVYLQRQHPPIIHRDIKPENILVDCQRELKVYLVDFGFARIGGGDVAVSSVVKGTLGFMPPEQLFNRQLTEASDLYSLGITLICLLTGTKSTEIGNLIDEANRIHFKSLIPKLNRQFVSWLEKMAAPSVKHRFENAATALDALKPIDVEGYGITLDRQKLVRCFKSNIVAGAIALSCFSVITWASLKLIALVGVQLPFNLQTNRAMQQLLKTGQCPQCNFKNINLRGANLEYANLYRANLESANLEKANLVGATLNGANLQGAALKATNLEGAKLEGVNLGQANLERANLKHAKLERANLGRANLVNANLGGANLGHVQLFDAKLNDAFLGYVNLSGANLQQADLGGANLGYATLGGANLGGANLVGAKLDHANLSGASLGSAQLKNVNLLMVNLAGAYIGNANLAGANLAGANLQDSELSSSNLSGAQLGGNNLERARLSEANLQKANLERANLGRAQLNNADLSGANLLNAKLEYARLSGANLTGTDLRNIQFKGANLDDANLEGANLEGAKLEYATLRGANLNGANLKGVNFQGAIMPDGSQHP